MEEGDWDEWDECRIGSRLEDYEDDSYESEDLSVDEVSVEQEPERIVSRDRLDFSYEGDASEVGNNSNSESSSISVGLASNSFGLANGFSNDANSDQDGTVEIRRRNKAVKRVARLKVGAQGDLDGTLERTSGSTSSPISSDNRTSTMPISRRKPILCIINGRFNNVKWFI